MKIRMNGSSVEISGYVNAVERKSKPLQSRTGSFSERICKGAFQRAIERNDDIHILLNHDWSRDLGGTLKGNLNLSEDSIGLSVRATVDDPDVVQKARNGELIGWSFGFTDRDVVSHEEEGLTIRDVKDLDLYEVSILDNSRNPAYEGTLLSVRDDGVQYHGEPMLAEMNVRIEPEEKNVDYSLYDGLINEMKEEISNV